MTNWQVLVGIIICAGFISTLTGLVWFVVLLVADIRARRSYVDRDLRRWRR